jgi:hypothetical protein
VLPLPIGEIIIIVLASHSKPAFKVWWQQLHTSDRGSFLTLRLDALKIFCSRWSIAELHFQILNDTIMPEKGPKIYQMEILWAF